jgi:uncharacterized membrane protein YphA (DoxX/SURF4 family)
LIETEGERKTMPTDYPAARMVAGFLSVIGTLLLLAGVAAMGLGFAALGANGVLNSFAGLLLLGSSILGLLFGLLYLANAQSMRANVDTADYNREILQLMRRTTPAGPPPLPAALSQAQRS